MIAQPLTAGEISTGPVFRVALGGKVSGAALADDSASCVVRRYAQRVGLDAKSYAGHSLRAAGSSPTQLDRSRL